MVILLRLSSPEDSPERGARGDDRMSTPSERFPQPSRNGRVCLSSKKGAPVPEKGEAGAKNLPDRNPHAFLSVGLSHPIELTASKDIRFRKDPLTMSLEKVL